MGPKCPYYLDPSRNDVTGREIKDKGTIEYIVKLHNEVRSKIARGWCDQPKAGCMGPVVSRDQPIPCTSLDGTTEAKYFLQFKGVWSDGYVLKKL